MGRPTLLTPERHRAIVAGIRAGAFGWVAAEANGVDRETLKIWLRNGTRSRREPYFSFANDVRAARAQARLSAELEVRKEQPFNWLRFGPGREREGEPGWTESMEMKHSGTVSILATHEWRLVAVAIEAALERFPEAKVAVAAALKELDDAGQKS